MIGIIYIATKKKMDVNSKAARKYWLSQPMKERILPLSLAVSMIEVKGVTDRQMATIQQTSDNSTCPEIMIVSGQ